MGPEAASELEPAGTWKGFCLPGATGCWEGSAKPGLLVGSAAGLEPACCAGQHHSCGLGMALWQDGCAVTTGGSLSPSPLFVGEHFLGTAEACLCSSSCAPVPGENWDSCTCGCCLSALVWSWHACQLEKLENCSWCPLEMRKGSPAWVLSCLTSAGLPAD